MGAVSDYIKARKKKEPSLRMGSLKDISEAQKYPPISTGNVVLDYVTSIGGIPRGLVTEIRGETGAGKTTAATQAAAQHQRRVKAGESTGAILFLDFEYAVNDEYFKNLGIDPEDEETFIYYQPDNLEDGFQTALDMTKEGLLGMIIVDSIAGAPAAAEMGADVGKQFIGTKAKALNQVFRMIVGPLRVHGVALILINHEQVKIPQTFAEKQAALRGIQEKISPGGKPIEYYTSLRIALGKPSLKKSEVQDDLLNEKSKQVTATEVEAYAFKNKLGHPHRKGKMRVHFGKGFSQTYSSFTILVDHKIITKKAGGHYSFPEALMPSEGKVPVGEDNVVDAIDNDPDWKKRIVDVAEALVLQKQHMEDDEEIIIADDLVDAVIDEETGEVLEDE